MTKYDKQLDQVTEELLQSWSFKEDIRKTHQEIVDNLESICASFELILKIAAVAVVSVSVFALGVHLATRESGVWKVVGYVLAMLSALGIPISGDILRGVIRRISAAVFYTYEYKAIVERHAEEIACRITENDEDFDAVDAIKRDAGEAFSVRQYVDSVTGR